MLIVAWIVTIATLLASAYISYLAIFTSNPPQWAKDLHEPALYIISAFIILCIIGVLASIVLGVIR